MATKRMCDGCDKEITPGTEYGRAAVYLASPLTIFGVDVARGDTDAERVVVEVADLCPICIARCADALTACLRAAKITPSRG